MSEPLTEINSPDELRQLLEAEGVDDNVIHQFVDQIGEEAVIQRVFQVMTERFLPEKAAGKATGSIDWEIKAQKETHVWNLTFTGDRAVTAKGPADNARVTLKLSLPDFLRLVSRQLNGVTAVLSGRLKFSGEIMYAQSMQDWFDW